MNRICWRGVDLVGRILEESERDAVRGDIAESGEPSWKALFGVLGLVVRRQAALWKDWRPWLILLVLILPAGMLLSVASRFTANGTAVYFWMYANNWDWRLLKNIGFWYELQDSAFFVSMQYLTLGCWSWSAGFLLGSVSRRARRVNGVLFLLMLVFGGLLGAPLYSAYLMQHVYRLRVHNPNEPISSGRFTGSYFP